MATSGDSGLSGRSIGLGAAGGAVVYVLGYLFTYVLTSSEIQNSFAQQLVEFATGDPGTWKIVGWVFYNAHFVSTNIPGLFGTSSVNLIGEVDAFSAVLYVIPPLLLVAAGLFAGRQAGADDPASGATSGVLVLAGYLPLAIVGALLFVISAGDTSAGPDLITGVLLAGAVYPAVFGAVGGVAAGATS
jgi:hypothetical protein